MQIVGLSGYARSGKDAAAKVLVDEFGFIRVAFADKLREVLYQLNPIVDCVHADIETYTVMSDGSKKRLMLDEKTPSTIPVSMNLHVQQIIDEYGWDGYKQTKYGAEIRRLLQRLGTEAGRQTLWDSIWVDAAFAGLPEDAKVVLPDTRFPNEAQAIKNRGGSVWRIMREGVGPINNHPSETSLDNWKFDAWINNNYSSVEDYRTYVRNFYLNQGKVAST